VEVVVVDMVLLALKIMEEQVQILAVDQVVVAVAEKAPLALEVLVELMDMMVVLDLHREVLNVVEAVVALVVLVRLVVAVAPTVMAEPNLQIQLQVHQLIMLVEVVVETMKVETTP
tara:strand:+ start:153 stop:500 length:348 start_codon:yes stop_codon:yes gene_type:complete